jgi:hypothetical protein
MKPMWMVRAEGGSFVEAFIEKGVVAMLFENFTDFDKVTSRTEAPRIFERESWDWRRAAISFCNRD